MTTEGHRRCTIEIALFASASSVRGMALFGQQRVWQDEADGQNERGSKVGTHIPGR